jgi:hypothetical protein
VPARFAGAMVVIVTVYVVAAEAAKRWFYRREQELIQRSSAANADPVKWLQMTVASSRNKGE